MENDIRILLCTEDEILGSMLNDQVRSIVGSFTVNRCMTATGSVLLASYYGPDAVLVDERLPGYETVIREVRLEDPRTMIALVTGLNGKMAFTAALAAGAWDYLSRADLGRRAVERCLWSAMARKAGLFGDAGAVADRPLPTGSGAVPALAGEYVR